MTAPAGAARAPAGGPGEAGACRNCGTPLGGPYCARCGQRDAPADPTFAELAGEAWDAFVSLDGKVATTLRVLLTRPGELTVQYLAGRRSRFVTPLRLYLTCSLGFFLLQAALPERERALRISTAGAVRQGRYTPDLLSADDSLAGVAGPEWSRRIQRGLRRSGADGAGFAGRVLERAPQVIFALVPAQALLLAAAYRRRRRRMPAHLVFALHAHAFFFVAFGAAGVVRALLPAGGGEFVEPVAAAGVGAHALAAARRAYGGRWGATLARGLFVALGYLTAGAVALTAALLLTFYQMGGRRGAPPVTRPSPSAAP